MKAMVWGLAAALVCVPVAWSATLLVPSQYATIQAAVDAAQPGDVVLVSPGTYSDVTHLPAPPDTTRCAVIMKSGITLMGSGPGQTIIDCNSLGRGIHCDGVVNSHIEGLTVREGFSDQVYGVGILCRNGSTPEIVNCEFVANKGGIVCLEGSSPTISDCLVSGNAGKEGAGVELENGSSPSFTDCQIVNNSAPTNGGGMLIRFDSAPRVERCQISSNTTSSPSGSGGGISVVNAHPTFVDCQIESNFASGNGGGLAIFDNSIPHLSRCSITGNETEGASGGGAGVYVNFAGGVIDNCLITDNRIQGSSSNGAGVYAIFATDLTLYQCTIAANEIDTGAQGGGIALSFASPVIEYCIIAFNEGRGLLCEDAFSVPVVSCSDVFGNPGGNAICGTDGGGNFTADPLFCNLAGGDYRIAVGSPCASGNHPSGLCGGRIGSERVGCTVIAVDDGVIEPPALRFLVARPNPFATETIIGFRIDRDAPIVVDVFDTQGRRVRGLADDTVPAGSVRLAWDGRDDLGREVAGGIYFYRVTAPGTRETGRLVLVR